MATVPTNGNGYRRRELRRIVLAEEDYCALCGGLVDKTLNFIAGQHGQRCSGGDCAGCSPHPMRAEVDEDIPRARGGSPIQRSNCHLMHRICNQQKGTRTLAEAKAPKVERSVTNLMQW